MDVYDFLNLATDLAGVIVSIFDCDSESVVFDSAKGGEYFDIDDAGAFHDYEVESYDLFKNNDGNVCLELNISMGGDD